MSWYEPMRFLNMSEIRSKMLIRQEKVTKPSQKRLGSTYPQSDCIRKYKLGNTPLLLPPKVALPKHKSLEQAPAVQSQKEALCTEAEKPH